MEFQKAEYLLDNFQKNTSYIHIHTSFHTILAAIDTKIRISKQQKKYVSMDQLISKYQNLRS